MINPDIKDQPSGWSLQFHLFFDFIFHYSDIVLIIIANTNLFPIEAQHNGFQL